MGIVVAGTVGLTLWIVLWALGIKSFDAFMLTALIVVVACTAQIAQRYLPGKQRQQRS